MTEKSSSNCSEQWIKYFEKTTYLPEYFFYRRTLLRKVKRYSNEGDLILEVGAGSGWSSIALAQAKRKIVALDIGLPILRGVRRLAKSLGLSLETICADMKMLPFKDNAFRIAFSQGLLEHFDDNSIIQGVKEQSRVASIVIVEVPTNLSKGKSRAFGNERWLSWKVWKKLLLKAGVKIALMYGISPSAIGFLLPLGIYKLISYRFSLAVGFVCIRPNMKFTFGGLKERLID